MDADSDSIVWGLMSFLMWRDGHDNKRAAASSLAAMGFWQALPNGRVWGTREPSDTHLEARPDLAAALERSPSHRNRDEPAEVLRTRFHAAERRMKTDARFRQQCEFWKYVHIEAHQSGNEPRDVAIQTWQAHGFAPPPDPK